MIPAWIMDWSFWLAIACMIIVPSAGAFLLQKFLFSRGLKDSSGAVSAGNVPPEAYRIVELREFLDVIWFKIWGHPIDDFRLVRIDRALGRRATIDHYRIQVMHEIQLARDTGRRTLRDP